MTDLGRRILILLKIYALPFDLVEGRIIYKSSIVWFANYNYSIKKVNRILAFPISVLVYDNFLTISSELSLPFNINLLTNLSIFLSFS